VISPFQPDLSGVSAGGVMLGVDGAGRSRCPKSGCRGTWGRATPLQADVVTRLGVSVSTEVMSVSCASPGNCAAVVAFRPSSGSAQALVADETNGTWGPARPLPGMIGGLSHGDSEADAVSCAVPGSCAVTGKYTDAQGLQQAFAASEQGGAWGQPTPFPLNAGRFDLPMPRLSCGAPGDCAVAGTFDDASGGGHAMVAAEAGGAWAPAAPLIRSLSGAVSCAAAGECTVAGSYTGGHLFTAVRRGGAWQPARQLPGETALLAAGDRPFGLAAVSCATPGNCAAGGSYTAPAGFEHALVRVFSATGGTPAGLVAVTAGKATVCVITLKAGRGTCAIGARKLRPGRYQLLAAYRGSPVYARSAAAKKTLVVTR
jgi:hypothetical protein